MKTNRFTTEQIIGILKEAESGMPVKELCRKYAMSDASLYNWKAKYGGMAVSEARRLKDLEEENRRLKKLVADQALDIQMLKEITKKSGNALSQAQDSETLAGTFRAKSAEDLQTCWVISFNMAL
jgi:putative transposase